MMLKLQKGLKNLLLAFVVFILLLTGIAKLLDVGGFAKVLVTYQAFPSFMIWPLALFIPIFEVVLGVYLIFDRSFKSITIATLLHAIYTLWAALSLWRGLEIANCGCFGVFWARPLTRITVQEDLVLTFICALIFFLKKREIKTLVS